MSWRLDRSRISRAWIALREDELAAQTMGINGPKLKNLAFALSAAYAGVVTTRFFARWENFVTPESFTLWESALLVAMVVLGRRGPLVGECPRGGAHRRPAGSPSVCSAGRAAFKP